MKKIIAGLICAMMIFSLSACSAENNTSSESTKEETTTARETSKKAEKTSEKKILVTYFSGGKSSDADAVSSATPKVGDMYVTEYTAAKIHDKVGGDFEPIIPEKAYPADYDDTVDKAKEENEKNARPEFTLNVNPEDYDVIFVGYPIWWYEMPMIMDTFFDSYDLGGKTIIPFNTHAGSGDGGTYEDIKELEPKADVLDGVDIAGSSGKSEIDSAVNEWLEELSY